MMACTSPLGISRLTPSRISLSSSASFTRRFLISSIAHVISTRTGRAAHSRQRGPGTSSLVGARPQLDLGWIEDTHPVALIRRLAVLVELDEERLAGAERLDNRTDVARAQDKAGARLG